MTAGKRPDMVVHSTAPYNAETSRTALAGSALTSVDAFYVRNHGPIPELDTEAWRLRIDGLVDSELELSLADLRSQFAQRESTVTLQCAGNRRSGLIAVRPIPGEAPWGPGATGTARWTGVALRDVLTQAGIQDIASHVELRGADRSEEADPPQRFGASITRHKALSGEVLLAWAMNGEPLPAAHGAPLRVIVPGYIGARSVKWLTAVTARRGPSENFFQARAYRLLPPDAPPDAGLAGEGVALGAVGVNSDILVPEDGATVAGGETEVLGYAFAGDDRHIIRVDVSSDGGQTWAQAELLDAATLWSWRRWRVSLHLVPGPAEVVARAWDSAASAQPAGAAELWNPKGYVNNSWARIRLNVCG
ncbi:MAG: sulfite oxidase [Actinomycetota bacterium]|nr:sulfite oxidase [Actinomycetota bacterium]